jgi:hypothetical protein
VAPGRIFEAVVALAKSGRPHRQEARARLDERKLAHVVRRRHGGRRTLRFARDLAMLTAAVDLSRVAVLGVCGVARTPR